MLRVDVTDAAHPVHPGDTVCLLGADRGLQDLANVRILMWGCLGV